MSECCKNKHEGKFLFGLFLGGLIGAGIIILLGTKEGKKIGKLLEKKGEDVLSDLEEKVGDLEEKGKELIAKGEEIRETLTEQFEEKKEDLGKEVTKRLDTVLASVEKVQEQGLKTTGTIRKHIFKNLPKKS